MDGLVMKANAPEKIYLQEPTKVRTEKKYDNDVEYIRTDAFIEKAENFFTETFDVEDAEIVKRILRTKQGDSRRLDYEKIIHICQERIRQIDIKKEQQ